MEDGNPLVEFLVLVFDTQKAVTLVNSLTKHIRKPGPP